MNHIFVDANNVNPEEKIPRCTQHNESFTYFCETCKHLVCPICLPEKHQKHDFALTDEAANRKRARLNSSLKARWTTMKTVANQVNTLEIDAQKIKMNLIKGIEDRKAEIIKSVNELAEKQIKKVKAGCNVLMHEAKTRRDALEHDRAVYEHVKSAVESRGDTKLLSTNSGNGKAQMCQPYLKSGLSHSIRFIRGSFDATNDTKAIAGLFGAVKVDHAYGSKRK